MYAHKENISRPYVTWVGYSEHNYWREYDDNSNAGYEAGRKYVKITLQIYSEIYFGPPSKG
jgi:hypothetical protein